MTARETHSSVFGPRRLAVVAAIFAVALAVAALLPRSENVDDSLVYESYAVVLISEPTASVFDSDSFPLADEVAMAESSQVAELAGQRLGFDAEVVVSTATGAPGVIEITATEADPSMAQQVAQVFAESFVELRNEEALVESMAARSQTSDSLTARLQEVDAQIAAGDGDDAALQELRGDLIEGLDILTIELAAGDVEARIISNADLPSTPLAADPQLAVPVPKSPLLTNLAIGALAAIVLSVLLWRPLGRLDQARVS